jgi:hypothetical protein
MADDLPRSVSITAAADSRMVPIISGATISALTGSPGAISRADTNRSHYGNYLAPGGTGAGYELIGGPLLNNADAASLVLATQRSTVETGPHGLANAAANNYYNHIAATNPGSYLEELRSFWSAYPDSGMAGWTAEVNRIDGACPMANPTTAEVLQWAANKWGINPLLLYAEATQEGDWDQTTLGDDGTSSGVLQISDRDSSQHPSHAFPGFSGAGSMLARENTCFNADYYAAHLYAVFHGLTRETPPGNIGTAIQCWFVGHVSAPGPYTAEVYQKLAARSWEKLYFSGKAVPY